MTDVDPGRLEARARASFARQPFMDLLGASIATVRRGHCEVRLPYRRELSQQHGYFHGGVVATLADVAGGYAAFSVLPDGSSNVTVEFKLNLMAPATGASLIARGDVVKAGRTLTVCRAEVFCTEAGNDRLCATALGTYMALPGVAEKNG